MPVASRPPWVKISKRGSCRSPATRLASMATTMHCAPNFSAAARTRLAILHRRRIDRDLVGAGFEQSAHVVDAAHAAADGQRHEAALGRAGDHVEDRAALLVAGGDVEEAELVGARLVVSGGGLDRIAGVAQIDEVDALDDAAVFDVEAGYDADLQHEFYDALPRRSPSQPIKARSPPRWPTAEQHERRPGATDRNTRWRSRDCRRSGRSPCRRSRRE